MSSTSTPTGRKIVLNTLLETEHYGSLIKDLTCTKCNQYMKPPIHLCVDGHSICGKCFEKNYQCHVCKKEFSLIRPIILESLANKFLFPCTNAGCPKHATLPVLEKHSPHCQSRIINCFMARVYGNCQWEGKAGEWMDHCFAEHKQRVTELPFITVKDQWEAKRTEPVLNYFLLRCYEKVFNVYQIYDKRGGRMMWTVLVNDDEAEKYYFEVDLFLPNFPSKRIVYRRPCKCEKDADFLEHTQNVYIPVENVFSMLDESESMNFTVRIDRSRVENPRESAFKPISSVSVESSTSETQVSNGQKVQQDKPKSPQTILQQSNGTHSLPKKESSTFDGMFVLMYPEKGNSPSNVIDRSGTNNLETALKPVRPVSVASPISVAQNSDNNQQSPQKTPNSLETIQPRSNWRHSLTKNKKSKYDGMFVLMYPDKDISTPKDPIDDTVVEELETALKSVSDSDKNEKSRKEIPKSPQSVKLRPTWRHSLPRRANSIVDSIYVLINPNKRNSNEKSK